MSVNTANGEQIKQWDSSAAMVDTAIWDAVSEVLKTTKIPFDRQSTILVRFNEQWEEDLETFAERLNKWMVTDLQKSTDDIMPLNIAELRETSIFQITNMCGNDVFINDEFPIPFDFPITLVSRDWEQVTLQEDAKITVTLSKNWATRFNALMRKDTYTYNSEVQVPIKTFLRDMTKSWWISSFNEGYIKK